MTKKLKDCIYPEGKLIADYPDNDCTDFAHPAWWRGYDYGCSRLIWYINELLDKKVHEDGSMGYEGMQELRKRLIELRDKHDY